MISQILLVCHPDKKAHSLNCAYRQRLDAGSATRHLDFIALKEPQYSLAKLSHMVSILRMAEAVGAISTTSSAYASVPT